MYADLDFESLRNLEPLLRGQQVLLAAMTAEPGFVHNIPNAWMASVRRHPFWLFVLQEITRTVGAGDFTRRVRMRARLPLYPQTEAAPPRACMYRGHRAMHWQMLGPQSGLEWNEPNDCLLQCRKVSFARASGWMPWSTRPARSCWGGRWRRSGAPMAPGSPCWSPA